MSELRISGVVSDSIVDGFGYRYTIFTQGCPHHCKGCHNPSTHDFNGGRIVDTDDLFNEICENILLSGVTFSGGEPFCHTGALLELARRIRLQTDLDITIYTGYTYEELLALNDSKVNELLSLTHYLIDGKYVEALRDLDLPFRGSSNQRMLNLYEMKKAK